MNEITFKQATAFLTDENAPSEYNAILGLMHAEGYEEFVLALVDLEATYCLLKSDAGLSHEQIMDGQVSTGQLIRTITF